MPFSLSTILSEMLLILTSANFILWGELNAIIHMYKPQRVGYLQWIYNFPVSGACCKKVMNQSSWKFTITSHVRQFVCLKSCDPQLMMEHVWGQRESPWHKEVEFLNHTEFLIHIFPSMDRHCSTQHMECFKPLPDLNEMLKIQKCMTPTNSKVETLTQCVSKLKKQLQAQTKMLNLTINVYLKEKIHCTDVLTRDEVKVQRRLQRVLRERSKEIM